MNNEFGLDAHDNLKSLLAAIQPEHIDYLTGATNTGEAIEYVTVTGFGPGQARKDVAQVMITLTDGLSQEPLRTAQAAEKAKKNGIYMFTVGVGNDTDEKELADISSNPDDDFVFHVDDFTALPTITKLLALKTCKAVSDENKPSELAREYIQLIYYLIIMLGLEGEVGDGGERRHHSYVRKIMTKCACLKLFV